MLTLRDLYEVNLGLAQPGAPISFYDVEKGIVSAAPVRPPAIIHNCDIENTLIGEGSVFHVRCILRADGVSELTTPSSSLQWLSTLAGPSWQISAEEHYLASVRICVMYGHDPSAEFDRRGGHDQEVLVLDRQGAKR